MKNQQSQIGAEATLTFLDDRVRKERAVKTYRNTELDDALRRARNKREAKILSKSPVRSPKLLSVEVYAIEMEKIDGVRLRDALTQETTPHYAQVFGSMIRTLHDTEIIHGDLTTSNILVDSNKELVLIDFGLSAFSKRLEDRATDLHVLRETLEGSHPQLAEVFWQSFLTGYGTHETLHVLEDVETRGRYKEKY